MTARARFHHRPLARGAGARRHPDSRLGLDLLHAGPDRAADRGRARLVDRLRHGRLFARAARRGTVFAPMSASSIDRFGGPCVMAFGSLIGALGLVLVVHAAHPVALLRGLDRARRRHGGEPLRCRLRHARPHLRRGRAPADHGIDARRRLRLDRELAGDACADRERGLARHLSDLCRASSPALRRRCTPSRCRGRVTRWKPTRPVCRRRRR